MKFLCAVDLLSRPGLIWLKIAPCIGGDGRAVPRFHRAAARQVNDSTNAAIARTAESGLGLRFGWNFGDHGYSCVDAFFRPSLSHSFGSHCPLFRVLVPPVDAAIGRASCRGIRVALQVSLVPVRYLGDVRVIFPSF